MFGKFDKLKIILLSIFPIDLKSRHSCKETEKLLWVHSLSQSIDNELLSDLCMLVPSEVLTSAGKNNKRFRHCLMISRGDPIHSYH